MLSIKQPHGQNMMCVYQQSKAFRVNFYEEQNVMVCYAKWCSLSGERIVLGVHIKHGSHLPQMYLVFQSFFCCEEESSTKPCQSHQFFHESVSIASNWTCRMGGGRSKVLLGTNNGQYAGSPLHLGGWRYKQTQKKSTQKLKRNQNTAKKLFRWSGHRFQLRRAILHSAMFLFLVRSCMNRFHACNESMIITHL